MIYLRAHAQRFPIAFGANGQDHKFLKIQGIPRMDSAVYDIHHGNRQPLGVASANIAVKRHIECRCRRLRAGERHA